MAAIGFSPCERMIRSSAGVSVAVHGSLPPRAASSRVLIAAGTWAASELVLNVGDAFIVRGTPGHGFRIGLPEDVEDAHLSAP